MITELTGRIRLYVFLRDAEYGRKRRSRREEKRRRKENERGGEASFHFGE